MSFIAKPRWFSLIVVLAGVLSHPAAHAAAALDTTFGNGGQALLSLPGSASVVAAALQADRILLLGTGAEGVDAATSGTSMVLTRLTDSGAIDSSFGNGGYTVTRPRRFTGAGAGAMAIDQQGRIVVAGLAADNCSSSSCRGVLVLARYLPDGAPDADFGQSGVVEDATTSSPPVGMAMQSDGKVVVLLDTTINAGRVGRFPSMRLARFDSRGRPDAGFVQDSGCQSGPIGIAALPDGKIVVAGADFNSPTISDGNCVARFNAQGSLDTSFGTKGIAKVFGYAWSDLVMETRGSILAGGGVGLLGAPGQVNRFLSSGANDFTFNSDGQNVAYVQRMALGCNGTYLLASGEGGPLRLSRMLSDGSLDSSFSGVNAFEVITFIPASTSAPFVVKLLLQRDGKIVVVSTASGNGGGPNMLHRFTQDSCDVPASATKTDVIEFYNARLDHYFFTAFPDEANALDTAFGGAWKRTGQSFKAFSAPDTVNASLSPLCRFYGSDSPGPNTHFYTARTDECAYLREVQAATPATSPRFNFEGNAFWVSLPVDGACLPSAPVGVIRLYNNGYARGADPNLRYTTDAQTVAAMVAKGWVSEGVAFCTRN